MRTKLKINFEYIQNYIKNFTDYKLLSTYNNNYNAHTKIILESKEGYKYFIEFNSIYRNHIPETFSKNNPYTIDNIKIWLKINMKTFDIISNKFEGSNIKLWWHCNICNEDFDNIWHNINVGQKCSYCSGTLRVSKYNNLLTNCPDLCLEWDYNKNLFTPDQVRRGSDKKAWWICKEHSHEWYATISSRVYGANCPHCNESKGEKEIENILKQKHISYIGEKTFDNCKNQRLLAFDFYLPDYNICIEYQGIQHYESVDFGGKGKQYSEEEFELNQKKDQIKRDYCKKNNINLIEIPYWEFNNIDIILLNKLVA